MERYWRDTFLKGGHDRHNGDIVAFHLSRLLHYRCVPLAVGRVIDLKREIIPVATKALLDYFYIKGGNTCFYGNLRLCNDKSKGVCADGVSSTACSPKTLWENDIGYCGYMKKKLSAKGPRLLDLIDMAISDYLIDNYRQARIRYIYQQQLGTELRGYNA